MSRVLLVAALLSVTACGTASNRPFHLRDSDALSSSTPDSTQSNASPHGPEEIQGLASFYGRRFEGKRTASGERFDRHALTAAHRTLPFGTRLQVTNLGNQKSVIVRVNDRGPQTHERLIDVSYAAARALGMIASGLARVQIKVLGK